MRTDVYQKITDQIVTALGQGVTPWQQPWQVEHGTGRIMRPLRANGTPYQGINVLMLWSAAIEKGYAAPIWMTFRQARELNAHVRKGEQGSLVVYADKIIRTETDPKSGEDSERAIPFMRGYAVFNSEQIDGIPEHYYGKPRTPPNIVERIAHAERFLDAIGARVVHGGNKACYVVSTDSIHLPCIEFFRDAESYYATRAHETVHYADLRIMPRRCRSRGGEASFQDLQRSVTIDNRRAAALRFADPRVQALRHVMLLFLLVHGTFTHKDVREHLAPLLGHKPSQYTAGRITYDLRRLRPHGLIARIPKTHRYRITAKGLRTAIFYTGLYSRSLRTGMAVISPAAINPDLPMAKSIRAAETALDKWYQHEKIAA